MTIPTATVKQLRDALNALDKSLDDTEVQVWLPGSRVQLSPHPFEHKKDGVILIEGNLTVGSALS